MKKFFNVAGPCDPATHYMLSPSARCGDVFSLIEQRLYFVLHAARQTGKTTMLLSLAKELEAGGDHHALYVSLEAMQYISEPETGIPEIVKKIQSNLHWHPALKDIVFLGQNPDFSNFSDILVSSLTRLAEHASKPVVLLFDEVDCLCNGTLVSFLRQLREGYVMRSQRPFIHSVALVGMRDVRDYKHRIRPEEKTLGSASPFNISTKSLTLRNFTRDEIVSLYAQHTDATGQAFPEEVISYVRDQTGGQPWLVNAIAREMVVELGGNKPDAALTLGMTKQAVYNIILQRATHIDSLLERLKEPRVQRVVEPALLGKADNIDPLSDDVAYVQDLGLMRMNKGRLYPANPIYAEVIGRELSYRQQFRMDTDRLPYTMQRFGTPDGGLDMSAMLTEFQQFWRENSDVWTEKYDYKEAAPHLILMAFFQRVLNGGGNIIREFATGRKRMDLIVELNDHRYPVEINLRYSDKTLAEGIEQLSGYLDTLGLPEGWLVIFDRRAEVSWDDKITCREEKTENGKQIHVYLM